MMCKSRHWFKSQTIAIVSGEKPHRLALMQRQFLVHCGEKIIVIDKYDVMSGSIHALQKTIAAIVDAVQHVREVIIVLSPYTITFGCRQHVIVKFVGENQRRISFLQAEALIPRVEYRTVALTLDLAGAWKSSDNFLNTRIRSDRSFNVQCLNHGLTILFEASSKFTAALPLRYDGGTVFNCA